MHKYKCPKCKFIIIVLDKLENLLCPYCKEYQMKNISKNKEMNEKYFTSKKIEGKI